MKITIKAENQIESTKVTHDWFHWSCFSILYKGYLFVYLMLTYEFDVILTLFRMGVSGLLTDWEEKGNKFLTCKMSLISYNEELCTVTLKRSTKKKKIRITWCNPWVLLTSEFFQQKSATSNLSKNTDTDCIVIHNIFFFFESLLVVLINIVVVLKISIKFATLGFPFLLDKKRHSLLSAEVS